jgi:oligopeptide transport system permease protein
VQEVLFELPEGKEFLDSRFGYSIRLVSLGALIAIGLGIPLGIWSGARPRSRLSHSISVGLAALISLPNFVLGLLAIIVFASTLKLIRVLPDWEQPADWIIPAAVLTVMPMASIARVTRAAILSILAEDFIRTARGKGLADRQVMLVHILRNALAPILTFLGPALMEMFTGILIVENLYAFPGFGREYWSSVLNLDYPMILGLTLIYAAGILLVNLVVEILCKFFDPRLRLSIQDGA